MTGLLSAGPVRALGPFGFNLIRQGIVTGVLLALVLATGRWRGIDAALLPPMLWSGLIGIFGGDTLLFFALRRLGPRRTGALFAMNAPIAAVLPGRRFYDPVAAALVEQRRDLLWSGENARRVAEVLRAVTWKADSDFGSARAYLVVRTALRRLGDAVAQGTVADVRDEVAGALWMAALLLEEGGLGDAAQRLAQAKERLQEALRRSEERIAVLEADGAGPVSTSEENPG